MIKFMKLNLLLALAAGSAISVHADPFAPASKSAEVSQKSGQIRSAIGALLNSKELSDIEQELSLESEDVRLSEIKLKKTIRIPGEAPEIHFLVRIDSKKGTQFENVSLLFVLRLQKVAIGPATTGLGFVVQSVTYE